jgi:hypothetical protein
MHNKYSRLTAHKHPDQANEGQTSIHAAFFYRAGPHPLRVLRLLYAGARTFDESIRSAR